MTQNNFVVGLDVGGIKKGFHAVAHRNGIFYEKFQSDCPIEIVSWTLSHSPMAVAIDSPCAFSLNGRSRKAERDLVKIGFNCFYTPTRFLAKESHFYDWVFNGELIYRHLNMPIYLGEQFPKPSCFETFPHAVHTSLWLQSGNDLPLGSKAKIRRKTLEVHAKYDISPLTNIDFVDAALCALSADYYLSGQFQSFGCKKEGFIVLPSSQNPIKDQTNERHLY
jgi:predicted nuclease with RNAse H fold